LSETLAAAAGSALQEVADGRLLPLPLTLRFWDGSELPADGAADAPVVVVRDRKALGYLLGEPNQIGLARAWVTGALDVEGDLGPVLDLRHRLGNVTVTSRARVRLAWRALRAAGPSVLRRPPVPSIEARAHGAPHSRARDRDTVRHHYDVSNRFYGLVLGPSMVYSCAYFAERTEPLEAAQERKLELICRKLRLQPGERLLDVGCGWGALLIHAARHHGVHGVGITLSEPQAEWARERIRAAGLSDRLEVRVADYRELAGERFDKIASVGRYEHVGREHLAAYAASVHAMLRPGGLFLNHGIARAASEPPSGDTFISRYVFPDGELHPVTAVMDAMAETGFEVRDVESLREHYPLTLRRWLANLDEHRDEVVAEVGEARERAWRLYLHGSAQSFEDGEISVYQVLAARDGAPHGLPLTREWLTQPRSTSNVTSSEYRSAA
jgi:cyclopropane-fatty-acyl-phospholipid synthase